MDYDHRSTTTKAEPRYDGRDDIPDRQSSMEIQSGRRRSPGKLIF